MTGEQSQPALPGSITERAASDPGGAIVSAYEHVCAALVQRARAAGQDVPADADVDQVAAAAAEQGVIIERAALAVTGLTLMQGLASSGQLGELDQDVCHEYFTLVDATLAMFDEPVGS